MKNASGNATIPQALQAIFDKYRAHFKALNRGARFIDKNLNRGRGDKYINPALPSAPIVAAAGGGPKSIGDITKGENLTNRYLSNDQLFGSKGTETRSYEVYRYQGGVYAWDGVRPALLWQSAKHVQGVSTIRQIGTGSMGAINLKEKNPSKVVKTLHGFRGDEFALYKGSRLHLYNNSLISMKYACMDHGIEDIFKIGLWNLKNGVDYKEDITYNMPFVKGRELRGEARKIPRQLMNDFSLALYKLNMAGYYHPDLIVCGNGSTQVSDQNLILLNGQGPIVAIDIDIEVRNENCPESLIEQYGYNLKDQWLVWCLYISTGSTESIINLIDSDYKEALSDSPNKLNQFMIHIPQNIKDTINMR
jgi:hypothetical protein